MDRSDAGAALEQDLVGHPLRRLSGSGPSDVEWALLVREVLTMKRALEALTEEVKKSNELATRKCDSCQPAGIAKDHEIRIRAVEKLVWKAMGIAAVSASLAGFLLGKVFK